MKQKCHLDFLSNENFLRNFCTENASSDSVLFVVTNKIINDYLLNLKDKMLNNEGC